MLHCLPSALDDVPTWQIMEIVEYRRMQELQREAKETEEKATAREDAAAKGIEALRKAQQDEQAAMRKGPKVIGKPG